MLQPFHLRLELNVNNIILGILKIFIRILNHNYDKMYSNHMKSFLPKSTIGLSAEVKIEEEGEYWKVNCKSSKFVAFNCPPGISIISSDNASVRISCKVEINRYVHK